MANSLMEFLLAEADTEVIEECYVSERFLEAGLKFKIRPLSGEEYTEIQNLCTVRKKKGKVDFDSKKFMEHAILKGCIEPNFKDAESIKKAKVASPVQLIYKLLRAGEISTLSSEIMNVSGFNQDMEDLEEEVKN